MSEADWYNPVTAIPYFCFFFTDNDFLYRVKQDFIVKDVHLEKILYNVHPYISVVKLFAIFMPYSFRVCSITI